jgi:multidrug efflux pump subunit AcrB
LAAKLDCPSTARLHQDYLVLSFVRLALRRPYTAAIAALLIALLDVLSISRMIVDIFPVIDIPVVLVAWNYPGLSAEAMERRVNLISERSYSTAANGIAVGR